ncbi:hypothetical protein Cyast_2156 [Cyanobacterium stanieri PCC 7202]|uniref:Uncharacterized protein n=1 Tax=Cyanobacterium stanieri (strain ATCC 29140 / PCC 7202) TaxID=292563 RepID=K9YME3_CYASC|nr:hypothetical protein Cyast_2156 [Cyanobacterium stanieri PCC 7202]
MNNKDKKDNSFLLEIGMGLLTPPILLGITISREVGEIMESLGEASEEIFRGQHLPILKNKN